jgi:hypothetical protein
VLFCAWVIWMTVAASHASSSNSCSSTVSSMSSLPCSFCCWVPAHGLHCTESASRHSPAAAPVVLAASPLHWPVSAPPCSGEVPKHILSVAAMLVAMAVGRPALPWLPPSERVRLAAAASSCC